MSAKYRTLLDHQFELEELCAQDAACQNSANRACSRLTRAALATCSPGVEPSPATRRLIDRLSRERSFGSTLTVVRSARGRCHAALSLGVTYADARQRGARRELLHPWKCVHGNPDKPFCRARVGRDRSIGWFVAPTGSEIHRLTIDSQLTEGGCRLDNRRYPHSRVLVSRSPVG